MPLGSVIDPSGHTRSMNSARRADWPNLPQASHASTGDQVRPNPAGQAQHSPPLRGSLNDPGGQDLCEATSFAGLCCAGTVFEQAISVSTAKPVRLYPLGHAKHDHVPISKNDPFGHLPTALPVLVALAKPQGAKRVFVRKSSAPQMACPDSEKAACVCCATAFDLLASVTAINTLKRSTARQSMWPDLKRLSIDQSPIKQHVLRHGCPCLQARQTRSPCECHKVARRRGSFKTRAVSLTRPCLMHGFSSNKDTSRSAKSSSGQEASQPPRQELSSISDNETCNSVRAYVCCVFWIFWTFFGYCRLFLIVFSDCF